jgi:hypothetical protein
MARMTEDWTLNNDRRVWQRFKISAPVTVVIREREVPAYTRDLSNRGVFLYMDLAESAQIDREFDFTVNLPPELTFSTCCKIRCKGRAVRTEDAATNVTGIAAEILEYSIIR